MMCYKDMTFCVSPNCENKCGRKLTKQIVLDAWYWWGNANAPIAVSCFCGGDLTGECANPFKEAEDAIIKHAVDLYIVCRTPSSFHLSKENELSYSRLKDVLDKIKMED